MTVAVGQQYRLKVNIGRDVVEGDSLGSENTPNLGLAAGSIGTVRNVVPVDEAGGGPTNAETYVLEYEAPDLGYDDNGNAVIVTVKRAVSYTGQQLSEWFEAV